MLNLTVGVLSDDWAPLSCLDIIIFVPGDTIDEDRQESSDSNNCPQNTISLLVPVSL